MSKIVDSSQLISADSFEFTFLQTENEVYAPLDLSGLEHLVSSSEYDPLDNAGKIVAQFLESLGRLKITKSNLPILQFKTILSKMMDDLQMLTQDEKVKKGIRNYVTSALHPLWTQSVIVSRAISKPLGYPGDYQMLQYLYNNHCISKTPIGQLFDAYFLADPLAISVINRVNKMSQYILDFIEASPKEEIHILNIASGSGFDLIEIAKRNHKKKVYIHCFDQDILSIQYAKKQLDRHNINTTFIFKKEDIRHFFSEINGDQTYDLIYNIGLADYLPDRILIHLFSGALKKLNSEGRLVISHKDHTKFPYQYPYWLCKWEFIHRSLSEGKKILGADIFKSKKSRIFFESEFKIIFFWEVQV